MATVVLVEGVSDRLAIEAAADLCGVALAGVDIVAMGGASNFARCHAEHAGTDRVLGLCDAGEVRLFARVLERAGVVAPGADREAMAAVGFFVCDRDLEDELVRAMGEERVVALIEREGELASLRTLQQMPFHRGGHLSDHLRRFFGSRSGRKHRYAPLLVAELEPDELPAPLVGLLSSLGYRARARSAAPPPR